MTKLPIAPNGIFPTIAGEGYLLGLPMTFIRLAGCSVGCRLCDSDYSVAERLPVAAIVERAAALRVPASSWAWITGGEPTDHGGKLADLIRELRRADFKVALATAGHREILGLFPDPATLPDWLSVSPHDPSKWVQAAGDELKLVPALNGFGLAAFAEKADEWGGNFAHRYAIPCEGAAETLAECRDWVATRPGWRLGVQAHKVWGMP